MNHEPLMVDIGMLTLAQRRDILFMIHALRVRNEPDFRQTEKDRYWSEAMGRVESPGIAPLDDLPEGITHLDRSEWKDDVDYTDDEAWK